MTQFNYDFEDDGSPILIEISDSYDGTMTSDDGETEDMILGLGKGKKSPKVVKKVDNAHIKKAYQVILRLAGYTASLIRKTREAEKQDKESDVPLKSVEIEFGVKFFGEASVGIGKAGAESNLNVRMTWERKP